MKEWSSFSVYDKLKPINKWDTAGTRTRLHQYLSVGYYVWQKTIWEMDPEFRPQMDRMNLERFKTETKNKLRGEGISMVSSGSVRKPDFIIQILFLS